MYYAYIFKTILSARNKLLSQIFCHTELLMKVCRHSSNYIYIYIYINDRQLYEVPEMTMSLA